VACVREHKCESFVSHTTLTWNGGIPLTLPLLSSINSTMPIHLVEPDTAGMSPWVCPVCIILCLYQSHDLLGSWAHPLCMVGMSRDWARRVTRSAMPLLSCDWATRQLGSGAVVCKQGDSPMSTRLWGADMQVLGSPPCMPVCGCDSTIGGEIPIHNLVRTVPVGVAGWPFDSTAPLALPHNCYWLAYAANLITESHKPGLRTQDGCHVRLWLRYVNLVYPPVKLPIIDTQKHKGI